MAKNIIIGIPEGIIEKLDSRAEACGNSRSSVIRELIVKGLNE